MSNMSTPESLPELIEADEPGHNPLTFGDLPYSFPDPTFFVLLNFAPRSPFYPRIRRPPAKTRMAIDPVVPYPDAHDLAQKQKGFYSLPIDVAHWQLRHYISTPEEDHVYYASGNNVYCLNTATKKRKHIATLPFSARCTASGYGWVCVGGEEEGHSGRFATIKLDGSGSRTLDVDAPLEIGGWRPGRRAPTVKVEKIGEEIVNSISIHRIQDEEAHLDDIVGVLTNNDKTVRIYSLPAGQETRVKDLPFAINHATISPDGTMMVAVGDYNQAYFFTREIVDTPPQIPKPHNRLTSASIEWRLTNVVTLHVTSADGPTGYFTTAWSPNGLLVAVGSECGYITIIDMDLLARADLDDDEAVAAIVPGSRADLPSPHVGAIRSMVFSPEPWDLLIWAEDHGRVCIGDLRTGLKSKQVINLTPNDAESYEKLSFEDLTPEEPTLPHLDDLEADILRRYRNAPHDNTAALRFANEYIEARRLQRQQRQELANARSRADTPGSTRHTPDFDNRPGLTAEEQQVLDALRTSRQREEARANGQVPRSVNYTSGDMFNGAGGRAAASTSTSSTRSSSRMLRDYLDNATFETFPELSRTHAASESPPASEIPDASSHLPSLHGLQDGIWGSAARPHRASDNFSRLPRRRQSAILSPPGSISPGPGPSASNGNGMARASSPDDDDEDGWRTIAEHMPTARGPLFEGAARARAVPPLPAADPDNMETEQDMLRREVDAQRLYIQAQSRARERWRSSRLAAGAQASNERAIAIAEARRLANLPPEGYEALQRRVQRSRFTARGNGERTAGLALSADGRRLWAACEKGIFEIDIRVKSRMFLAAVDPR